MQKRSWKRIAYGGLWIFLLLVVVLGVHIYVVTRPKPLDPHLRVMARIDIKQDIDKGDADRISAWMYQQPGVDHVLCNPVSDIVVFTFFPAMTTADAIVTRFKSSLPYKAVRFVPTAEQLKGGCPVAATSATYKIVHFFRNIF